MVQYSDRYDCVISADEGGFVEYWKPAEPFELPKNLPGLWNYKSETDLYEFKKVSGDYFEWRLSYGERNYSPDLSLPVYPSAQTRHPLPHSRYPTVKSVSSLFSRER